MSDLNEQLPKADALMDRIESGENRETRMSCALEASLWIPEICRLLLEKTSKVWECWGHSTHHGDTFPLEWPHRR